MATLNEVRHNVRDAISGGSPPVDTPISLRQIGLAVRYYRELLIRRDTNFYKRTAEFEQDLGLVGMSVYHQDIGKYGEQPSAVLRSNEPLPARLHLRKRRPLTHVSSPDLGESYDVMQPSAAKYQHYNKYTPNTSRSFVRDDYLYITSDQVAALINDLQSGDKDLSDTSSDSLTDGITTVRVRGIFSEPTVAYQFKHKEPYDPNTEYPATPNDLIQRITQSILNAEAQVLRQSIYDTENDNLPVRSEANMGEQAAS